MNIDSLKAKFDEAWRAQFESVVREGENEDSARKFASSFVQPFAKRVEAASDAISLFENAIGCELPSSLNEFWKVVDLWGAVIWDVEFKLSGKSQSCGDRYLDGVLETSLMNHRYLKLEKEIVSLAFMGEAWLGYKLPGTNSWPIFCFDSDGKAVCAVGNQLDDFLYACAELTIAYASLVPGEIEWKERVRAAITPGLVAPQWVEWMLSRRPRPI